VNSSGVLTVTGMTRGATSQVTLTATRAGYPDGVSMVTCSSLAAAPPSAPLAVTVKDELTQLSVGWSPPVDDGGSPLTGYAVRVSDAGGTPIAGATCTSVAVTYCSVAGLTTGTPYLVEVRAANAIGDGPWSAATPATPEAPSEQTLPSGPESADLTLDDATPPMGGTIELVAQGFRPGTQVDFWIHSTPQLLGSAIADGTGVARLTVALPVGLVDAHTVQAVGISPAGATWNLARSLTIASPGAGRLSQTGVETAPTLTSGLLLLVFGLAALLLVGSTRRRGTHLS
jgi:hypothetical protein